MRLRPQLHIALLASVVGFAGCGGEAAAPAAGSSSVRQVHGAIVKGPLVGASVAFFHVDQAGLPVGVAITTATTDEFGHVTTGLPNGSESLLAISSGGSYVDESDDAGGVNRRRITLTAGQGF